MYLDKALCNDAQKFQFPNAPVKVLPIEDFSDQELNLISLNEPLRNFKFECAWVIEESYKYMITNAWKRHNPFMSNLERVGIFTIVGTCTL